MRISDWSSDVCSSDLPGRTIGLVIRQSGPGGALQLIASQTGRQEPLTDRNLLAAVIRHLLMTVKVIAGIHWQALQLLRKGAAFFRWRRPPAEPVPGSRPAPRPFPQRRLRQSAALANQYARASLRGR